MTPRQLLAKIRKLLASPDLDSVRQGVDLIDTLGAPALRATFCAGLSVDGDGEICWARGSEVAKRVKGPHRPWAALALMRLSGDLLGVERLDLRGLRGVDTSILQGLPNLERLSLSRIDAIGAPLETLPALRELFVDGILPTASQLAALSALESLTIERPIGSVDLGRLAAAPNLRELSVLGAHRFGGLDAIGGLVGLESLTIRDHYDQWDLSALSGLERLEHLALYECTWAENFQALGRLSALRSLAISRSYALRDLSSLSGLGRLESLSLRECGNVVEISPLADLPALRRLDLERCYALRDPSALAGRAQIAEGVAVEEGRVCRGGQELEGWTLYAILATGAVDLSDVEHLTLHHWRGLTDLGFLTRAPALRELDLKGCEELAEVWPLVALGALERVDITRSPNIQPRPKRTTLADRASVAAWQEKIARALDKKPDRTPEQGALLEIARQRGLLQRAGATAAQRAQRRDRQSTVKQIRVLLSRPDLADARQGVELLSALGDAALTAEFANGVSIDPRGKVLVSAEAARRGHLRSRERRGWMALWLLRLSGQLADTEVLSLTPRLRVPDLSPLADLPALRTLLIANVRGLTDLSPLSGLSGLTRLELAEAWTVRSLQPLSGLAALERLRIAPASGVRSVRALAGLSSLQRLSLPQARHLSDLSPLRGLPALSYLDLVGGSLGIGQCRTRTAVTKALR